MPIALPATPTVVLHSRLDLSQLDGPVTITAPANATPVDHPAVIFQAAGGRTRPLFATVVLLYPPWRYLWLREANHGI
jgi:hypothetical protein